MRPKGKKQTVGTNVQQFYEQIINSTRDGMFVCDRNGRFVLWNPAMEQTSGLSQEQVLGKHSLELFPFMREQGIFAFFERALAGESVATPDYRYEVPASRKSGWASNVYVPLRDAGGEVIGVIATVRDITKRKRIEEELRRSEERYRSLAEAAHDMIFVIGKDDKVEYVNTFAAEHIGRQAQEIVGCDRAELFPHEVAERQKQNLQAVLQTGAPSYHETLTAFADRDVWLGTWLAPLKDATGMVSSVLGISRDITELKRAEKERLEMERRLLHAQKLESLGVLAGGIAHDFNNLLMAILGNLDLALRKLSPLSPAGTNIQNALQAVHRGADLTRQMLAYSGKGQFVVKNIDLSELVEENAHLFRTSMAKTAALNLRLNRDLPLVEADPGQITQVIMNLITNASEAVGEKAGVIALSTGIQECDEAYLSRSRLEETPPAGRFVYLEVSDTGSGMDEETQQKLFDPFFTTKFTGRGLGMSAVLGIMRGHKGAILVDSVVGKGTTIRVLFPVSETAQPEATRITGAGVGERERQESSVPRGTVLVVEDEEMVLDACKEMVESLGFPALAARDGREAVNIFREHAGEVVCILLDLSMPGMDGLAACSELRRIRPDVRVVLTSGYNEEEATQRFTGQGLAAFLQKPYEIKDLGDVLGQVL